MLFIERLNELIENTYGKKVRDAFAEKLNSRGWKTEAKSYSYTYLANDSVFLGTWSGILTQFGQSLKFRFTCKTQNDLLELSLDSPDQDATGLIVSDVVINENILSFKPIICNRRIKSIHQNRKNIISHDAAPDISIVSGPLYHGDQPHLWKTA
jgi:hypothetical protein